MPITDLKMKRSFAWKPSLTAGIAALALLAAATGCSSSPETHYYTLSTVAPSEPPAAPSSGGTTALGAIILPKLLDQPQIARRTGANEMDYAEFDRWAASLDDLVRHALTEDLSADLGQAVLPSANAPGGTPAKIVKLEIGRFEADSSGTVTLDARWTVSGMAYPPENSLSGAARITNPAQGTTASGVAAGMSEALGQLSVKIAETVRAAKP